MDKILEPITPGEFLRDHFMKDYGLTQTQLAVRLGVPSADVNRIVNNKRRISPEMAMRLGACFGTSPQMWLNVQTDYDLRLAQREKAERVKKEVRPIVDEADVA